jgi:ribonucleoside-diphosphate reductase beta chain
MILEPGLNLTLRPMQYPQFYEFYRQALRNTWSVDEIDWSVDLAHLRTKISPAERHMINRLVAFFATGDTIVNNNLAVTLYGAINSPEARMYLSRQIFEEAQHVQFYLTLLDSYIPDLAEREAAFRAVDEVPSIRAKALFCERYSPGRSQPDDTYSNLIAYAACIEGIFFFSAFAYVYFLRSKGLLPGLAAGTNWVFRDESLHISFAMELIAVIRKEYPHLKNEVDDSFIHKMVGEAVNAECGFADDLLQHGVAGLAREQMHQYIQYIADVRLRQLGVPLLYNVKNPFPFMELQDVQELTNFFERRVSAYQTGIKGKVAFDASF